MKVSLKKAVPAMVLLGIMSITPMMSSAETAPKAKSTTKTAAPKSKITKKAKAKPVVKKVETKKPETKPAETKPVATTPAPAATAGQASAREADIISQIKDIFVCPDANITIREAEEQGALCTEGQKVIDSVSRIMRGIPRDADILNLVSNYRNQGRQIVETNGQPVCAVPGKLKLEFFIMSFCPYGVKFVDSLLHPIVDDLGAVIEWTPRYILGKDGSGKIMSLHGQKEVDEDLRQICIREKYGNKEWLSYFDCFNKEIYSKQQSGPKDWKYCAEMVKLDASKIEDCFNKEAAKLAEADMGLSNKYDAQGSPTAVYNCGKNIVGAMPLQMVKPQICKLITGQKPASCSN